MTHYIVTRLYVEEKCHTNINNNKSNNNSKDVLTHVMVIEISKLTGFSEFTSHL